MEVGLSLLFDGRQGNHLSDVGTVARWVEVAGFSSLWYPDHVVTFDNYGPNYPYSADGKPPLQTRRGRYAALIVLAAAASTTTSIRLGTAILILPERNPVLLASEVTALDHLSGGRFELGVGVGWSPEEYSALGVPFARRGDRADEYLEAMRRLWTDECATYDGTYVSFRDVVTLPKPLQKPHPPIWVGGESRPALRRAARFGSGWISGTSPTDQLPAVLDRLGAECETIGRDPATLKRAHLVRYRTRSQLHEQIQEAAAYGVDEVIVILPWPELGAGTRNLVSEVAAVCRAANDR